MSSYEEFKNKSLENSEVKKEYDELQPEYDIIQAMIVAFTNNDKIKDIRNQVAISELEGKVINMGNIFDNIAAKEVIESAKYFVEKMTPNEVVTYISSRLGISLDEAKEIFEKEVLMLETV